MKIFLCAGCIKMNQYHEFYINTKSSFKLELFSQQGSFEQASQSVRTFTEWLSIRRRLSVWSIFMWEVTIRELVEVSSCFHKVPHQGSVNKIIDIDSKHIIDTRHLMCCFTTLQTKQEPQANVSAKTETVIGDVKVSHFFVSMKFTTAWYGLY